MAAFSPGPTAGEQGTGGRVVGGHGGTEAQGTRAWGARARGTGVWGARGRGPEGGVPECGVRGAGCWSAGAWGAGGGSGQHQWVSPDASPEEVMGQQGAERRPALGNGIQQS